MRIATWNVERLKHSKRLDEIIEACKNTRADILVLTETDERIVLPYQNCFYTEPLVKESIMYKSTERRVAIYTNYPLICVHKTYDSKTALCVELETNYGNLLVYGTIIGVYGNRNHTYLPDLKSQIEDYRKFSKQGNLCIAGDFNCSFEDNYYYTVEGRKMLSSCFSEIGLKVLTEQQKECVDHIAFSARLVKDMSIREWNTDKTFSDHKGVEVNLTINGT